MFEEGDYDGGRFSGPQADAVRVVDARFDACTFEKSSFEEVGFRGCVFETAPSPAATWLSCRS